MLYEPIFSPKDFERQKAEIETFMNRVPDLENRRRVVEQWQDAIRIYKITKQITNKMQLKFKD